VSIDLNLGFIALLDCAPLAVAKELGYFAQEGLNVSLRREVSWATIRDKVAAGVFEGAHMLGPMPIAAAFAAEPAEIIAPMALNAHGAAVAVSIDLARSMRERDPESMNAQPISAVALARVIRQRQAKDMAPLTFAVVYPYSAHNYMLRYWLAAAGIDPDRDLRIIVAPPTAMVPRLVAGEVDGFCVGAPWATMAERQGLVEIVLDAHAFWPGGPDKVFGVSRAWAEREPRALQATLRALLCASIWADAEENATELAALLARDEHVDAPAELILRALGHGGQRIRFARGAAAFPWRSHAAWFLSQMLRWGQIEETVDCERGAGVYRPDLFRAAAADLGYSTPMTDSKIEGAHPHAWTLAGSAGAIAMSADMFLDGEAFSPDSLHDYAAGFDISRLAPLNGA
jgi:ABC-type nitrate/sulfonate/bicarbonate transport system substrate-binding protein